jgi:hypothetical protein
LSGCGLWKAKREIDVRFTIASNCVRFANRQSKIRFPLIHIAVLIQPYLDFILQGKKTVESRLTMQARDPFDNIEKGERIYFKQSSGPYRATAIADQVLFEDNLTPRRI